MVNEETIRQIVHETLVDLGVVDQQDIEQHADPAGDDEIEQLASQALSVNDLRKVETHDLAPSEVLEQRYDIDVESIADHPRAEDRLLSEVRRARSERA